MMNPVKYNDMPGSPEDPRKGKGSEVGPGQELGPVDEEVNISQRSSRSLEIMINNE